MQNSKDKNRASPIQTLPFYEFCHVMHFVNEATSLTTQLKNWAAVVKTNNYFYQLFNPELQRLKCNKLLTFIVNNHWQQAIIWSQSNPRLLLMEGSFTTSFGQTLQGTPFQMALSLMNSTLCLNLATIIKQIPHGPYELSKQIHIQLPDLKKAQLERRFDFNDLVHCIAADKRIAIGSPQFTNDKMSTATAEKLEIMRDFFLLNSYQTSQRGFYFNLANIKDFFTCYHDLENRLNWSQKMLCFRQVFLFLHKLLPKHIQTAVTNTKCLSYFQNDTFSEIKTVSQWNFKPRKDQLTRVIDDFQTSFNTMYIKLKANQPQLEPMVKSNKPF